MDYATEQEIAEAFGVELPEGAENDAEGGHETPEDQDTQEGAHGDQGGQEPAQEGDQSGAGGEPEPKNGAEPTEGGKDPGEMSPDERHRQAAARRAREEAARAAAEQARVDKIYADMFAGQVSPYTGKPISTEAEFRAYQAEKAKREQTAQLEKAGITPETIQGIVKQELAPVQQRLQQAEMAAMQEKAKAVNERAQASINAALKNISTMDPGVKTLEDIAALPTAARFNDLVQKGIGLEDAFYLANRQAIDTRRAAAAKAAALNNANSRRHLDPVPAGGGKLPVEVPQGVVEAYREMMPEATDAEIREAYEKTMKSLK